MSLKNLTNNEKHIILESLKAAVYGPFFPKGLFQTLLGINRSTVIQIILDWPNVDEQSKDFNHAVHSALSQLTHYPHHQEKEWSKYINVTPDELNEIFYKWKGLEKPLNKWDGNIKGYLTPRAQKIWDNLSEEKQKDILSIVWCNNCSMYTTMTNYEGGIDKDENLSMYGICVECFKEVNKTIPIRCLNLETDPAASKT